MEKLTKKECKFLSEAVRAYKESHRGVPEAFLALCKAEEKLAKLTDGRYESDTTYDVKTTKTMSR